MRSDCQQCGACCFSTSDTYVQLTKKDEAQLANKLQDVAQKMSDGFYLRMKGGHCQQLVKSNGVFECQIYGNRPSPCRELVRGSPACLEERREKRKAALHLQNPPS